MFKLITSFATVVLAGCAISATLPPASEISVSARQPTPGGVGVCGPKFTEKKILPVALCFCHVLFAGDITVNVQERAEADCLSFFGSEEAILELENTCAKFTKFDGTLKKMKLEKKLNNIHETCFPDEDITVIVM